MKTRRLFSLIAAILVLVLLLAACAPAASGESSTDQDTTTPADTTTQDTSTDETDDAQDATEETEAEPVTITYANFNASGGKEEVLQAMYEAFHEGFASHPDEGFGHGQALGAQAAALARCYDGKLHASAS